MSLRREIHSAFDVIAPPSSGMSERVVQTVLSEHARRRRKERMLVRLRAPLSLVAVFVVIAVVAAVFVGGRILQDWNVFRNVSPAGGGAAYQSQVAQLEARPLSIQVPKSRADCVSGPLNGAGQFGSGPVYGSGGSTTTNAWGFYFHSEAYATTKITGPIVIRAIDLFTSQPVVFVGKYASGPVVGSDTVDGKKVDQYRELVLDENSATSTGTRTYDWPFIAGVPNSWSGSTGWQIDGQGFSETFLAC